MSSQVAVARRRNARRTNYFPGDPRYADMHLTATRDDYVCLAKEAYLSTAILDILLQCTALPYPPSTSSAEGVFPPMIGSLGCETFISSSNLTASFKRSDVQTQSEWKHHQQNLARLRHKFSAIIDVNATTNFPQRLIVPVVSPPGHIGHFFVASFDFSIHDPKFFVDISFYDSLERAKKRVHQASQAAALVKKVNSFFKTFIIHDRKYFNLHQSDSNVVGIVQYRDCPLQRNGYDCGIFAVACTLHLAERIPLNSGTFSQEDVTTARLHAARALST